MELDNLRWLTLNEKVNLSRKLVENNSIELLFRQVNGVQTQGENIADNAGIKLAYRSMSRWLQHNKIPRLPGLHHLTAEQLFFVNFAQVCGLP